MAMGGYIESQVGATGQAVRAEMNRLIQRYGRKIVVLLQQGNGVYNFYLALWRAGNDKRVSPLEEGWRR